MTFTIAMTVADAIAAMARGARPVAGGSDLVVGARHGKAALPESIVAIDRLSELAEISSDSATMDAGLRIGALVTHALLMSSPVICSDYTALADAAALVGSPSTRNVGTLGGNVMNASPAMDTGAPLLVFGATAELTSVRGTRRISLGELWTGPGQTSAAADELCTALLLAPREARSASAYVRLEYRRAMEIAVVGAAASVTLDEGGSLATASIALTAVAPTVIAVAGLEAINGMTPTEALGVVGELVAEQASPISDLRASDRYRRHCVAVMAGRALQAAARRAVGDSISVPVNRAVGIGGAR